MERITIDDTLAARLHELAEQGKRVLLVDSAGRVVADAEPRVDPAGYAPSPDEFTAEEIERRCAPGRKTYTTEELLTKLRSLS